MRQQHIGFIFLLSVFIILQGCSIFSGGQQTIENGVEWPIEDFEYTNHNGEKFGKSDLEGKVWLANFIFTNCKTVCPPITANMARVQKMLQNEGLTDVEIVSFSVDPEVDTPEALKEFAFQFTDNLDNWNFLTGYVQLHIEQFAKDNFKMHVKKPENDDQVMHGTDMYLVNQEGTIVKYYSALDVPMDEILHDIQILLNQNG